MQARVSWPLADHQQVRIRCKGLAAEPVVAKVKENHIVVDEAVEADEDDVRQRIHICQNGNLFRQRYAMGKSLGSGGFSKVKEGTNLQTGEKVAIKIVDKARYAPGDQSLQREIEVLLQVKHPNCIQLKEIFATPRKVYLITELARGGELLERLTDPSRLPEGKYTEAQSSAIVRQILEGVAYLHDMGIVHRDLKLENLLLKDESMVSPIKIADFGLSKFFVGDEILQTMCGSLEYVAPEVLETGVTRISYTPAIDMWSVGVILYILLSGFTPFYDDNDPALIRKIKRGEYSLDDPVWKKVSDAAKDVVAALLTVNPNQRLTAREVLALAWVQGDVKPPLSPTLPVPENVQQRICRKGSVREAPTMHHSESGQSDY
eukprot:jgi/Chlat1/2770/Chrsp187S02944